MNKFSLYKLAPMLDKAGSGLSKVGKAAAAVVKDQRFQSGVLTTLLPTLFLIYKYQKQAKEKEELYKKALAKHNAIIKELDAKAKIDKERQNRC